MKKTAMQLMIEWMDSREQAVPYSVRAKATELLETERENIQDAHYEGGYNTNGSKSEAEQYYKETYRWS